MDKHPKNHQPGGRSSGWSHLMSGKNKFQRLCSWNEVMCLIAWAHSSPRTDLTSSTKERQCFQFIYILWDAKLVKGLLREGVTVSPSIRRDAWKKMSVLLQMTAKIHALVQVVTLNESRLVLLSLNFCIYCKSGFLSGSALFY